ncbi:composite domain of metallo-dependent hydrolase [Hymenopellis radicata]|nr:composite domain of metallo-dependent hydrolase [Hymenopellis radicata]
MAEKAQLSPYRANKSSKLHRLLGGALLLSAVSIGTLVLSPRLDGSSTRVPLHAAETLQKCRQLDMTPGPPPEFWSRTESDRFVEGTRPVYIKNATIWTGGVDGLEVIKRDLLLARGLIQQVGSISASALEQYSDLVEYDAEGAWVSPGIFDLHSHMGVSSLPVLDGASDTDSLKGDMQPWLRSLDGLNTHDDGYKPVVAGGVTTGVILPGSANGIGGQAFVIKYRPTAEKSPSSMLLEPPHSIINGSNVDPSLPPRWRQMKHACGENPSSVYDQTRMDTIWHFRQSYNQARQIKEKQDAIPEDLQWEALVDVLRGRVKIHNHCYEAVDLDGIVRLTNEFKFSIAAFHHAHETYLVPDLLKKAYGTLPLPSVARYKREAYRGSEFAPKILAENGIKVVMKSDHPLTNSRYLLHEAQQAHYYGLPDNLALASVTSTPATVAGLDHRVGFIRTGYDADVVIWDSHPLALGATPKQPAVFQKVPETPDFEKEAKDAVKYDGLPPLTAQKTSDVVVFTNVSNVFVKQDNAVVNTLSEAAGGVVVVKGGNIVCSGSCPNAFSSSYAAAEFIDLEGGSISSSLGLEHIMGEPSTNDGSVPDALSGSVPAILGPDAIIHAVDGLQFESRDMLIAYRAGVTTGVTAPSGSSFISGYSTAFSTGSSHKLAKGAIVQSVGALHVAVTMNSGVSVSTQIAALRALLLKSHAFDQVRQGSMPLVINVDSADIMATLIQLKSEVEVSTGETLKFTFVGGSESHLLASEISGAGIGVILIPSRPFPITWEGRRFMPGPPLSHDTIIGYLLAHNITVGIGIQNQSYARNTRFDVGWAALSAFSGLSKTDALALATTNLEQLLGISSRAGSLLDFEAKVVGVISPRKGVVDLF